MAKPTISTGRPMARVIAFPGVTPTPAEPEREPVTSVPCPVCAYPIESDEFEGIFSCTQRATPHHEPCFWRASPLEDWLAYCTLMRGSGLCKLQ
jgi:hypothetical protein